MLEACLVEPTILAGVMCNSGTTALVSCTAHGGNGSFGGPGVSVQSGHFVATRSEIRATTSGGTFTNPAIFVSAGDVLLEPSTLLVPTGTQPGVAGATPVVAEFASLRATVMAQQVTFAAHGPAGAAFATLFSLPAVGSVTPFGATWLDPAAVNTAYFGVFDPTTRLHTVASPLPPLPPLPPGLTLTLQSIVIDANGLTLGLRSMATVP